ncbi:MAG: glutathione S-transferase N-terminal domain-containing protein [Myxococcota bacterium]
MVEHPEQRKARVEARGRATVPVLRIAKDEGEDEWMPESADIVRYLYAQYGDGKLPPPGPEVQRAITATMWILLIAGGFLTEYQAPLWLVACALGAGRSVINALRTRAAIHFGVSALFVLGCVSIGLRLAGSASFPWWHGAYGLVAVLALVAVVQRLRRGSMG